LKNRGISLFLPLSLIVYWRKRDMMNLSGLESEGFLVHFKGLKGENE